MFRFMKSLILCSLFVILVYSDLAEEDKKLRDRVIRAEVQSCRGCALNRLSEVKSFIYDDLPEYVGVVFHPIPGAVPQLVLFNEAQEEVKRIDLSPLSRNECNALLKDWGFKHAVESDESSEKTRIEF